MVYSSSKSLANSNIGHLIATSPAVAELDQLVDDLPDILEAVWTDLVTVNSLTHGQYLLLTEMISRTTMPKWLKQVREPYLGWQSTEDALALKGKTSRWYYQKNFITEALIDRIENGEMTVEDLAIEVPETFFFPLFKGVKPVLS